MTDFNAAILPAFEGDTTGVISECARFAERLGAGVDSPSSEISAMNGGKRNQDGLRINEPRDGESETESGAPEPAEVNEGQRESTWAHKASFANLDVSSVDEPPAPKKELEVGALPSAKQATSQKVPEVEELPSPTEKPRFGNPDVDQLELSATDHEDSAGPKPSSPSKDSGFGISEADVESPSANFEQAVPPVDPSPQANEMNIGRPDDLAKPSEQNPNVDLSKDSGFGVSDADLSGKSEDKSPVMVSSSYTPPNDAASSSQASSVPKISTIKGNLGASLEPSPERLQQAALKAVTVTPENEELLRLHHPCFEGVEVETFKHPDLDPVWVVRRGTSTTPLNWLSVAGRTVHLFNFPWVLDPTRETATPLTFAPDPLENIQLNPRHMLSDGQVKDLSVLFPNSIGCRVHLSGHLVMLFPTTSEALHALKQTAPRQFGGLEVHYAAANPVPLKNSGSFGLRIRLPIATHDVLTTMTHEHVRSPGSSTTWDRISSPMRSIRHAMAGSAPLSRVADNMGIQLARKPVLVGKQVVVPGFEKTPFEIEACYDDPSPLRPFPTGYHHNLSLLATANFPDTAPAPGLPKLVGFADDENTLASGLPFFVGNYDGGDPLLNQALVEAVEYKWNKEGIVHKQSVLWRTVGKGGNVLCVGDLAAGSTGKAVVLASFEVGRELRGGYVLPAEVTKANIIM